MFNQQLSTLYYGIRDADTGEWLTGMYRVLGGEQERGEGREQACSPPPRRSPTAPCDPAAP